MAISKLSFGSEPVVEMTSSVNRAFIIDCSGSMYSDLPHLRKTLKNKIPELTNIGDTISILWFSGRGECGIIQEAVEVRSVKDFTSLNTSIDKWLVDIGLTGFKEPIELATDMFKRISASRPNTVNHVMFLTDGYDNQSKESEIMDSLGKLGEVVNTFTIVEYGYYCNRPLLTKMAEAIGGNLIFNNSFDEIDTTIERNLTQVIKNTKKRKVTLTEAPKYGYVFVFDENKDCFTFATTGNEVAIPENLTTVSYISDVNATELSDDDIYQAIYTLSQRQMTGEVWTHLSMIGDVALINKFSNCFTKQDYSDFQDMVMGCIKDESLRYVDGKDLNAVPKDDAYTLTEFCQDIDNDDTVRVYPYHESFKYERIGVERVNKDSVLTDAEIQEKEVLVEAIKNATTPDAIKEAGKKMEDFLAVIDSKVALKFTPNHKEGYSVGGLVYNETRPNISFRLKIDGYVEMPKLELLNSVPTQFPTYIYRNYTLVKDGIKHSVCNSFPMSMGKELFDKLQSNGLLSGETWVKGKVYIVNLNLPVVNRKMAVDVSAKEFFGNVLALQQAKSEQKVWNSLIKLNTTEVKNPSPTYDVLYGEEVSKWLVEHGLSIHNGFSPLTVKGESRDVYMAREFEIKIAKCSSIPTINEALINKVKYHNFYDLWVEHNGADTKKPTALSPSEGLCESAINSYIKACYVDEGDFDLMEWLTANQTNIKCVVKELSAKVTATKFAICAGQTWFSEFSSLDENQMTITFNGKEYTVTAELSEKPVAC